MEIKQKKKHLDSIKAQLPQPLRLLLETSNRLMRKSEKSTTANPFLRPNETVEVNYGVEDEGKAVPKYLSSKNFVKELRLKELLKRDRSWVEWFMKIDGNNSKLPALKIIFKHLPNLDIVVVQSKICLPIGASQKKNLSDLLLLRGENVLHFLYKDDTGFENPNPNSQLLLDKLRILTFSELALVVGYPYRWAQDLCDLKFDFKKEASSANSGNDQLHSNLKFFRSIFQLIFVRFRSWVEIWEESRATELRICTERFQYRPWTFVDREELERLFRIDEELVPVELNQGKRRFIVIEYNKNQFEVRVAVILPRQFPVELPVFELEVVDKRGSVPKFVNHTVLVEMQQDLNFDRFPNAAISQLGQILQIIKLMFFVDELLQPQTFQKISGPMPTTLKIRIRKKNSHEILFGSPSHTMTEAANSARSPEGPNKRQASNLFAPNPNKIRKTSSGIVMGPGPKSKTHPPTGSSHSGTNVIESRLEKAIQDRRINERSKKVRDSLQVVDENAVMDITDVIQSSNKVGLQGKHFNVRNALHSEIAEEVPCMAYEIECGTSVPKKEDNGFKFPKPSSPNSAKEKAKDGGSEDTNLEGSEDGLGHEHLFSCFRKTDVSSISK